MSDGPSNAADQYDLYVEICELLKIEVAYYYHDHLLDLYKEFNVRSDTELYKSVLEYVKNVKIINSIEDNLNILEEKLKNKENGKL